MTYLLCYKKFGPCMMKNGLAIINTRSKLPSSTVLILLLLDLVLLHLVLVLLLLVLLHLVLYYCFLSFTTTPRPTTPTTPTPPSSSYSSSSSSSSYYYSSFFIICWLPIFKKNVNFANLLNLLDLFLVKLLYDFLWSDPESDPENLTGSGSATLVPVPYFFIYRYQKRPANPVPVSC